MSSWTAGRGRSGRFHDAYPHFQPARRQFEAIGDRIGQARIHDSLAWLCEREQHPADALGHAQRALELSRAAGHRPGQAAALNSIGFCQALRFLSAVSEATPKARPSQEFWQRPLNRT